MDTLFRVEVLSQTPDPERVIWLAMHQDYSAEYVTAASRVPANYGEAVVRHLLEGDRGHYGPLEHPQITFAVGYFPHLVVQQARTHRIGVSFDVQSFRYTGKQLLELGSDPSPDQLERVFYVPANIKEGQAKTREGVCPISPEALGIVLEQYRSQVAAYRRLVTECGVPPEDARCVLGYGIRQHFVVSFNCRSLMHFLDLRAKADAQREIRELCDLIWPHFEAWCPHIAAWYRKNRWGKARLSP
ncbi:FAD-dependent thymidylate synthase [Synechococcus sp. W70.1]|uniref:FAD-dependent thymidylate synthase n=1 Tax=Synechococcus sp. W70.1 TaxID=2964534 RepID=UPI0039C0743F